MSLLSTKLRPLVAFAFFLFATLVVVASTLSPVIKVDLNGSVSRGGRQLSLEEAGRVNPGEVIHWNITVSNRGNAPASGVTVVGDIDDSTAYVPGSASSDGVASVKYSLEHPHGNQTFYERPMVRVTEDGVVRERPASPDKYKAVQFTFPSVGANEVKKAIYRTRVR